MKKIFSAVFLMLSVSGLNCPSFAVTSSTITPIPPINYLGNFQYDNYPKVTQLEQIVFGRTFQADDIYNRISRIEARVFNRTNSNMDLAQRVDLIATQVSPAAMYNIPVNQLASIEMKLFNRIYTNDDPETRIIRIEKEMLGAIQSGDLKDRFDVIAQASKHYNAFPTDNYSTNPIASPYIATSNTGGAKGILKNILSTVVGGALTGFTPSITDPYGGYCSSPYMNSQYGTNTNNWAQNLLPNNGAGFNNYTQSNTGYSNYNKNYGTGSGVHVLYD